MLTKEPAEFAVTQMHVRQRRKVARLTVIFMTVLCAIFSVVSLTLAVLALRSNAFIPGALFLGVFALSLFPIFSSRSLHSRLVGQLGQRRVTLERKQLLDANDLKTKRVALKDIKRLEVLRNRRGELLAFNAQTETSTLSFAGLENMDALLGALSSLGHVSVTEKTKWLPFKHTELQFAFYVCLGVLLLALNEVVVPTMTPSLFSIVLTSWLVISGVLELFHSANADTHYLREKRRGGVTYIILGVLVMGLEWL